jgi:hypothetical protein
VCAAKSQAVVASLQTTSTVSFLWSETMPSMPLKLLFLSSSTARYLP